jgi:hypothetical protein
VGNGQNEYPCVMRREGFGPFGGKEKEGKEEKSQKSEDGLGCGLGKDKAGGAKIFHEEAGGACTLGRPETHIVGRV